MVNEIIVAFLGPLHLTRHPLSRPITPTWKQLVPLGLGENQRHELFVVHHTCSRCSIETSARHRRPASAVASGMHRGSKRDHVFRALFAVAVPSARGRAFAIRVGPWVSNRLRWVRLAGLFAGVCGWPVGCFGNGSARGRLRGRGRRPLSGGGWPPTGGAGDPRRRPTAGMSPAVIHE